MSALCCSCGLALDPDAPGAACPVCHGEQPSPAPVSRRPSARASGPTHFARVALTAAALSTATGTDLDEHALEEAVRIHTTPIEA